MNIKFINESLGLTTDGEAFHKKHSASSTPAISS